MADYEFEDVQGNRYRLIRGAGPGWHHANNLGRGSSMVADQLLGSVADAIVYKAYDHFYFDVLSALPDASPLPREALSEAIASSHLVLERLDSALAIGDEEPDPRQMLRVRIQSALFNIIAGERAEAAMHERMLSQESAVTKVAIYTGAFMTGIGSSAWGLALWAKEVSDVVNPVVRIHNNIKAIRAAWDSENFAEAYSSNILSAEKRELVEALGFDPTAINAQQIDEAIAMSDLVMSDESLREMLYRFVKDYAEAQHSIEIAEVAGSGAFEIILTIILAAVTGGAGVLAIVGSKAALIRKFSSVGDLLSEFAQASKKIALRNSKCSAKQEKASFKDLETSEGRSGKTDARGAESGKPSAGLNAGLHNQDLNIEVKRGSFRTVRAVDLDDLSESDAAAFDAMKKQGWSDEKIEEVLSSGENFRTKEINAGDKLYGFGTDGYPKDFKTSAYWMDEQGFNEIKAKHFKNGTWDRDGVKNSMALPCFNRANSIDVVEVSESHIVVESDIGKATEILQYSGDNGYSTGFVGKIMPGGGVQIAPNPSMLSAI